MSSQEKFVFASLLVGLAGGTAAHAADSLPYTERTRAYSGWNTSVNGDVRTVGMAGSTVGLPDTFLSSTDNPAGLSMLLVDANDNLVSNNISDNHVQNPEYAIRTNSLGVALNLYPWGFSAGYITTSREGQTYALPATGGQQAELDVSSHEYRFGVSRVLFDDHLAAGATLNIGVADEQINPGPSAQDSRIGATFGLLYRFPRHWIMGASYALPMQYTFADASARYQTPQLPGFFKPLTSPMRLGLGVACIPNRFFRVSLSLFLVGTTLDSSLLQNDAVAVGTGVTLQPRLGAAYTFVDFKEFSGTAFAGTYLEMTRIDRTSNRVHLTSGIELHPWIFNVGVGSDFSAGYNNFLIGFGVDIFKVLVKTDLIPTPYNPPRVGLLPNPRHLSDEGLPRTLAYNYKKKGPDMNPFKVIQEMPERAEKKYEEIKTLLEPEPLPTPTPHPQGAAPAKKRPKPRPPVRHRRF